MVKRPNRKTSRNAEIMKMQASGSTYQEIASAMGISKARVGQIVKRAQPKVKREITQADIDAYVARMHAHLD